MTTTQIFGFVATGLGDRRVHSANCSPDKGALHLNAMEVGDGLADCLAEYAEERRFRGVDSYDVHAFLPKRRCHFRADEPHAYDDDSRRVHLTAETMDRSQDR